MGLIEVHRVTSSGHKVKTCRIFPIALRLAISFRSLGSEHDVALVEGKIASLLGEEVGILNFVKLEIWP